MAEPITKDTLTTTIADILKRLRDIEAKALQAFIFSSGYVEPTIPDLTPTTSNRCYVYDTSNQSISTASFTNILTFASETHDPNGMHSTVTNTGRITIQADGVYKIMASARWADSTGGSSRGLEIYKNGSSLGNLQSFQNKDSSGRCTNNIIVHASLVATDYLEVRAYQDTGGNLNMGIRNFIVERVDY